MKQNLINRKLKILKFSLLFFIIFSNAQNKWDNHTFIHRDNQQILDGKNNAVKLNGFNLGGWLMWEGWIWGGGFTKEKIMFEGIEKKIGYTEAANFRDSVYANFITESDIKKISEHCFNVVRIPINHTILEEDNTPFIYKNSGWKLLDTILEWCEIYNVYAILDLHAAPGGQASLFTADADVIDLWSSEKNQNRTVQLWKAIASRYKNKSIIAGYDLLNEPDIKNNKILIDFYKILIENIRTVDKNHLLLIEGNDYARDFSFFEKILDENMAFEFHLYSWMSSITKPLEKYSLLSQNLNVPLWCGEWGENTSNTLKKTLKEFNLEKYHISGNAYWTYKKQSKLLQYPCYQCYNGTKLWNKTIKWIDNKNNSEPTIEEIKIGLSEFLTNIKSKNTLWNKNLNDILQNCKNN